MIVVTGATGRSAGIVARELALGVSRSGSSSGIADRAPDLPAPRSPSRPTTTSEALAAALEPGDRVFMVSMHAPYAERLALHQSFVEVAARRQVGRVVYLSFIARRTGRRRSSTRARMARPRRCCGESGLSWSAVRNGMYGDEIASWFDDDGRITGPGATAGSASRTGRSSVRRSRSCSPNRPRRSRDRHDHDVRTRSSLAELAAIATDVTGDPYRYEPLEREDWIAYRRSLGRPDWSIEAGDLVLRRRARGEADVVSDDYRATDRPPRSVDRSAAGSSYPLTRCRHDT